MPPQRSVDQQIARRNALAAEVDSVQHRTLADDAAGRRLLAGLDKLSLAAATTAVTGPGLTLTVTEPSVSPNLSDVSKQRVAGSQQIILDRDLQLVLNSLWHSGAEAISVGGVRIGPNVTIRQAGGAILVDNNPIASPYYGARGRTAAHHARRLRGQLRVATTQAAGAVLRCGRHRQRERRALAARRSHSGRQVRQTDRSLR